MGESAAANEALVNRFYTAFKAFDPVAMNACYAPDISFTDPVFETLNGDRARGMWMMLAMGRKGDWGFTYTIGPTDDRTGTATWVARYEFSATGRQVDNHVSSKFWFEDGLIKRQEDSFDLWRWAGMALGPRGRLLGWLPPVQAQIRKQAAGTLDKFMAAWTA